MINFAKLPFLASREFRETLEQQISQPSPEASRTSALTDTWQARCRAQKGLFTILKSSGGLKAGSAVQACDKASDRQDLQSVREAFAGMASLLRAGAPHRHEQIQACEQVVHYAERIMRLLPGRQSYATRTPLPDARGHGHNAHHHHHHHHHEHGAVAVDLDEAVHGLYTALVYIIQAAKGNGREIADHFVEDARLLAQSPMHWLKETAAPHGTADFALGVGVAGALLPLAILAIHAGWHETRGALHERKDLAHKLRHTGKKMEALEQLLAARTAGAPLAHDVSALAQAEGAYLKRKLQDLRFSKKRNKESLGVGVSSLVSGGAIAGQGVLAITSKSMAITGQAAASAALGAAGVAGAVLTPLAAAGALGLGISMTRSSHKQKERFREGKQCMETRLRELLSHVAANPGDARNAQAIDSYIETYRRFLSVKSKQRDKFLTVYDRLNKVFLAGSALYASSALMKTVVLIIAVAAVAGSVHFPPALLVAITAGMAMGGGLMAAGSAQFFTGHGKQHRYAGYRNGDDPELDRRFLSLADLLCAFNPDTDPQAGLKLRARFLEQSARRDDLRKALLQKAEQAIRPKGFPWTRKLTVASLEKWLQNKDSDASRIAFMKEALTAQTAYLKEKIDLKICMYHPSEPGGIGDAERGRTGHPHDAGDLVRAQHLRDFLVELDDDLQKDLLLFRQAVVLQDRLEDADPHGGLGRITDWFIALQCGKPYDPNEQFKDDACKRLAAYLMKEAPKRYRDLRGMLLETEMQAARMHRDASALVPQDALRAAADELQAAHERGKAARAPFSWVVVQGKGAPRIEGRPAHFGQALWPELA